MKNLVYINVNEFAEFDSIISSLPDEKYVTLDEIKKRVLSAYKKYLNNFSSITKRKRLNWNQVQKEALHDCYNTQNSYIYELRTAIKLAQEIVFRKTCPYCMVRSPDTLDHYIEKEHFPEYSMLIKNIVPSCIICNSSKKQWVVKNKRQYIHFYNDLLPTKQFLFVNISFDMNFVPAIQFYIDNPNRIMIRKYNLIKSHFQHLDLIRLYNLNTSQVIDSFATMVSECRIVGTLTDLQIQTILQAHAINLSAKYGINYFKSILWTKLANEINYIHSL
jgi:hypothetical protein